MTVEPEEITCVLGAADEDLDGARDVADRCCGLLRRPQQLTVVHVEADRNTTIVRLSYGSRRNCGRSPGQAKRDPTQMEELPGADLVPVELVLARGCDRRRLTVIDDMRRPWRRAELEEV